MADAKSISDHWATGDVYVRILEAMKAASLSPDTSTVEQLAPVDHFHARGLPDKLSARVGSIPACRSCLIRQSKCRFFAFGFIHLHRKDARDGGSGVLGVTVCFEGRQPAVGGDDVQASRHWADNAAGARRLHAQEEIRAAPSSAALGGRGTARALVEWETRTHSARSSLTLHPFQWKRRRSTGEDRRLW